LHPESKSPQVVLDSLPKLKTITIPASADTSYAGHGYFRYIGKFPPQIVSYLLNTYKITGPIADTMCGGGTTLIEAKLRGIDADGTDINPLPRLICQAATTPIKPDVFDQHAKRFIDALNDNLETGDLFASGKVPKWAPVKLNYCKEYFDGNTLADIAFYQKEAANYPADIKRMWDMTLFAILRRVSKANIKKMNLEIDEKKQNQQSVLEAASRHIQLLRDNNRDFYKWTTDSTVTVSDADAADTKLKSDHYQAVFLHPPYLTNTAFSEFSQLQLALMDINHKEIWKKELRCRGSFLHEPNGLKKYLVGWNQIMKEAVRILKPGGYLFTVVGDGQVDFVRIPVGAITDEYGSDMDLELVERLLHVLKNHTGQTQSRKMIGQHISVFRKPS
jgi:hypothetical protein